MLTRPQDLAAKHVADATGHLLIEQCVGDRRIEVGVVAQSLDRGVDVGCRATQIGPEATEPGVSMGVELAIGLDGAGTEADGGERVDGDADTELRHRLPPALAGAIEVPATRPTTGWCAGSTRRPTRCRVAWRGCRRARSHGPVLGTGPSRKGASNDSTALPTRAVRSAAAVR